MEIFKIYLVEFLFNSLISQGQDIWTQIIQINFHVLLNILKAHFENQ